MSLIKKIYLISGSPIFGEIEGVCRVTGKKSKGLSFKEWVKKTFTDYSYLYQGEIISNEALFSFLELSEIIQKKVGKEKPQNFRTYSHIVYKNEWLCFTKANKKEIVEILKNNPEFVCLTSTGQKHLAFKNKEGFWQLDEIFVVPDIMLFTEIHEFMIEMLKFGYNQKEIITGIYKAKTIKKIGIFNHLKKENYLSKHRGKPMFDFCAFLMYSTK